MNNKGHLGSLSVIKKDRGFSVLKDGQEHKVAYYNTDEMLNKMNTKQLAAFLANNGGRIDVNQLSDDEYTLKAKVHGKGGGPLTACVFYWGTKAVAYGGLAVGAVTAGYLGGGVLIAGGALIGGEAGAIVVAGTEVAAEVGIKAAVAAAGPAVVAGIETGAAAAGAFGLAIPFLP